jgi:hypothetical protein
MQILAVQSTYYSILSLLAAGLALLTGVPVTLSRVFAYEEVDYSTVFGWGLFTVFLLSSALTSLSIWKLVTRVRLCLDFSCTVHFIHVFLVWNYSGFPTTFFWWLTIISSSGLLFYLSEKLCVYEEMKPIALSGNRRQQQEQDFEMSSFINP